MNKGKILEKKHFLMKLINFCLIIAICLVYQHVAVIRAAKEAVIEQQNQEAATAGSQWNDGTYEGSGTGFGGIITVSVTIAEGKIDRIDILEASGEDTAYFDNAVKIIDTMLQVQSPDVDIASGATYSSNGIIEAVQNALKEAS
jgi:uncharacterized protein with FMN-binding domain